MKTCTVCALALISTMTMADESKVLELNGEAIQLSIADFKPITKHFAHRQAVVGYEALIDVQAFENESDLIIKSDAVIGAKWFASQFAVTTRISCSGTPLAMSLDFGYREKRQSIPAKPQLEEIRFAVPHCSQLKIELSKEGALARQFYTQIDKIDFAVSLSSNQGGGEE